MKLMMGAWNTLRTKGKAILLMKALGILSTILIYAYYEHLDTVMDMFVYLMSPKLKVARLIETPIDDTEYRHRSPVLPNVDGPGKKYTR